jgi:hypothetical protein
MAYRHDIAAQLRAAFRGAERAPVAPPAPAPAGSYVDGGRAPALVRELIAELVPPPAPAPDARA